MTIYDYECQDCKAVYEIEHPMKDNAFTEHDCPNCKKTTKCKRLIGNNGGFRLVGQSWGKYQYEDQYKKTLDLL
jgi:putative FmdB family regulatory protein